MSFRDGEAVSCPGFVTAAKAATTYIDLTSGAFLLSAAYKRRSKSSRLKAQYKTLRIKANHSLLPIPGSAHTLRLRLKWCAHLRFTLSGFVTRRRHETPRCGGTKDHENLGCSGGLKCETKLPKLSKPPKPFSCPFVTAKPFRVCRGGTAEG